MKHLYLLLVLILPYCIPARAQNYALRFFGNGVNDIDRVKIPIEPHNKADVGYDFTIEFQMKADAADNPLGYGAQEGYNDDWTLGHIIVDRDIFGNGDYGDYGISLAGNRIAFGVNNGSWSYTLIGGSNVANGQWRHIAVTRNSTTGQMRIFIDGVQVASATGPTGDVSYRDNRPINQPWVNEPYIVLGAEKHDYDPTTYPPYNGFLDELRISNVVRYTGNYTPVEKFTDDANTMLLYHFDEPIGNIVYDYAIIAGPGVDGTINYGGNPAGPERVLRGHLWTGSVSTLWSDPNNWSPASLPGPNDDVLVPAPLSNYPKVDMPVSNPAVCKNLYAQSMATLTISPGCGLTVGGSISYAFSSIMIECDNNNVSGSLIHSTPNLQITMQRYIPGHGNNPNTGWHLLASPVNNYPIPFSDFEPGLNDDFYAWDEDDYLWRNYKVPANNIVNFVNGQGYLVAYYQTTTKTFSGFSNISDITWSNLSVTPGQGNGWHLLGNPFQSALKWEAANWNLSNFATSAKILNAGGTYEDITYTGPNQFIPANQGFFVRATSPTNSITIPAASRQHNATPFYKGSIPNLLTLKASDETFYVKTWIQMLEGASAAFEDDYDVLFLAGVYQAPQLYSRIGNHRVSTNVIGDFEQEMVIPLEFKSFRNRPFTLTAEGAESFEGIEVYLVDSQTGARINLKKDNQYTFMASAGELTGRFSIHLFKATGIPHHQGNDPSVIIYSRGNSLYLSGNHSTVFLLRIYHLSGQELYSRWIIPDGLQEIPLQFPEGVYIVSLAGGKETISRKVYIGSVE